MSSSISSRKEDDTRVKAVIDAVEGYSLEDSSSWDDLDVLSSNTYVDGIEVDPKGVVIQEDSRFEGVANIYVVLRYGSKRDAFDMSESFLGRFSGYFDREKPVIENLSVDTSSFYEGESSSS